ncbi:hypothetical protein DPEC_G00219150 [Dallia pectoralis]|uniref:Uncharacterized protein n=1 Tax=Dallia pectoralis TaxID=75939 RepID=A0ACC2G2X3_DALPE|nr:hypothetical protein DPEC_G00219150 [Dallia pectoralis]
MNNYMLQTTSSTRTHQQGSTDHRLKPTDLDQGAFTTEPKPASSLPGLGSRQSRPSTKTANITTTIIIMKPRGPLRAGNSCLCGRILRLPCERQMGIAATKHS